MMTVCSISGEHLRILSCLAWTISLYALVGPECCVALGEMGVHFSACSSLDQSSIWGVCSVRMMKYKFGIICSSRKC